MNTRPINPGEAERAGMAGPVTRNGGFGSGKCPNA